MSNPWGQAANAYGQEMDRLTQIQGQGMQQQAQLPMQLYQSFTQGYRDAQERKDREAAQLLAQKQYERQMMLAEETHRNNVAREEASTARLKSKDEIEAKDRVMQYFEKQVDPQFSGDPRLVPVMIKQAVMAGIPEQEAVSYFESRKIASKPGVPLGRIMDGGGAEIQPEPESYQPGTKYSVDKAIREETARKNLETEEDRRLARKYQGETVENQRKGLGLQAAALGKGEIKETAGGFVVIDPRTGAAKPVVDPSGAQVQGAKGLGSRERIAANKDLLLFDEIERLVNRTKEELKIHPKAVGITRAATGTTGEIFNQYVDPKGVKARALLSDLKSSKLKERAGTAQTKSELTNLLAMVPNAWDKDAKTVNEKLDLFIEAVNAKRENVRNKYGVDKAEPETAEPPAAGKREAFRDKKTGKMVWHVKQADGSWKPE